MYRVHLLSMCILVLFYILSSRHFDILRDQAFLENLIYFSFFFLRDFSSRMRKGVVKRKIQFAFVNSSVRQRSCLCYRNKHIS